MNATADRVDGLVDVRGAIRGHVRILARVLRVATQQVTIEDSAAVDTVVFETVLHQRSLADGGHEASVTLRHRRRVVL